LLPIVYHQLFKNSQNPRGWLLLRGNLGTLLSPSKQNNLLLDTRTIRALLQFGWNIDRTLSHAFDVIRRLIEALAKGEKKTVR
jgi:hypothetical protein